MSKRSPEHSIRGMAERATARVATGLLVFAILTACVDQETDPLQFPFFNSEEGIACNEYSAKFGVDDVGSGQVRGYGDSEPTDTKRDACYFAAYLKLPGITEGDISFTPDWCPTADCGGIKTDFWEVPSVPGVDELPFTIGYPLPAEGGVLHINDQSFRIELRPGENIVQPPSKNQ